MTMDDSDFMLEMKNYEETRQYAILSHDLIKKEDHEKWLPKNLQYFQVIEVENGQRAGAVRLQDDEISIWIDRKFRHEGLAIQTIETMWLRGTTEGGGLTITAKIVDGNITSLRAFIRAGFLPIIHIDNYYIFQR